MCLPPVECECKTKQSANLCQCYKLTIQAKSGPAAINKMQGTQKSPKDQSDGSSFTFLFHESPSHHIPSNLQKLDSALWWLFIFVWTQKEAAWHEGSLTRNQTDDLFPGAPSISKQSIRKLAQTVKSMDHSISLFLWHSEWCIVKYNVPMLFPWSNVKIRK